MKNVVLSLMSLWFGLSSSYAFGLDEALELEVRAAECAFAGSMAVRDFKAFSALVDEEAIFISGNEQQAKGKAAVLERWQPLFDAADAPFSWWPETVAVLGSGTLALSAGPVVNPQGEVVNWYQSIWRKNVMGTWQVIFDRGHPVPQNAKNKPVVNRCQS